MNNYQLKVFFSIIMFLDHLIFYTNISIKWYLLTKSSTIIMLFITMEGFKYTSNKFKYLKSILLLTIINWLSSYIVEIYKWGGYYNIIHNTILFNYIYILGIIYVHDYVKSVSHLKKQVLILLLLLLALTINILTNILQLELIILGLIFYYWPINNKKKQSILFVTWYIVWITIMNIFQLPIFGNYGRLLALPFIMFYNNKKGDGIIPRSFFYWYFPIHQIILALIFIK